MGLKNLVIEGRVEDVLNKHFKGTPGGYLEKLYYDEIVPGSASINPNHKYLEWIARNWDTSGPNEEGEMEHNLKEILLAVSKFDNESQRLEIKDLNQYKHIDQLFDALKKIGETARRTVDITDDVEKIYEDNRFVVVSPKTHTASCYYGAGTKWCTATKENDSHFSTYKGNGELYYIIDKTLPTSSPYYKVALNKKVQEHKEDFWDAKDDAITDTNRILPIMQNSKMIEDIRNHFAIKFKERIEQEIELQSRRLSDAEERRERERMRRVQVGIENNRRRMADEWNPDDTDKQGILANALKEWLIDEGEWEGETKAEVQHEIDELREVMNQDPEVIADPSGERAQDYGEDLNNLEEDLENTESVYDITPLHDYYGMYEFEYGGAEYAVGDDEAADEAAFERTKSLIDDIGYEGFNPGFMESHIDGDQLADYMEDWFYDDINDRPEDYLDEDNDRELTKEAEQKIDNIDGDIGELQEELEGLENEDEDQEILDQIDELEMYKEEISDDDDNWEYTEAAKDEYVEDRKSEVRDDPWAHMQDWGMEERVDEFIDEDDFIDEVVSADGRGHTISSYDGVENEITYEDEWYYIYRTN
tara:strand:+ start:1868 stop:3640 length:1773 start_codon:yes stop_codon:yes gene_type:complete